MPVTVKRNFKGFCLCWGASLAVALVAAPLTLASTKFVAQQVTPMNLSKPAKIAVFWASFVLPLALSGYVGMAYVVPKPEPYQKRGVE